jgi:RecA-family ATPase
MMRDKRISALIEIIEPEEGEPAQVKVKGPAPPTLDYITGEALEQLPLEPVEWFVDGFIQRDVVNGLFGDGGTGKDYLLLQLMIAMATDSKWLGRDVVPGKVMYFNVEDRLPRIRWRQNAILKYLNVSHMRYPDRLRVVPMVGQSTIIATYDSKSGLVVPTPMLTSIRNMIEDHRPDLVVMGNRVNIFSVNQNEDSQARQCTELLNAIGIDYKTTLIMPGHVSIRGLSDNSGSSGSGSSGTVQWSNALRHRLGLSKAKKDEDSDEEDAFKRTLTVLKSNDALTDQTIDMHWSQEHLLYIANDEHIHFTPAPQPSREDRNADVEEEVLRLLRITLSKKQRLGTQLRAHNNAAKYFSLRRDCKYKGRRELLEAAIDRLLAKRKIELKQYGPPSAETWMLIIPGEDNVVPFKDPKK